MAKNYKDFDDSDGVWRTVGGRRIFIKNGQDLASAMKESGKFKSVKDREHQKKKIENEIERHSYSDKEKKEKEEEYDAYDKISQEEATKEKFSALDRWAEQEKKQKEVSDKLNEKNRQHAQDDIKEYLNGNNKDWEEDGDFIRDLANEYNLELDDAKAMFNVMKVDKDAKSKYRALESLEQDVEYDKAHGIDTESKDYLDSIYDKAHEKLDKEYKNRYTKDKVMSRAEYEKELDNDPNKDEYVDASYESYLNAMEDAGHDVSKFKKLNELNSKSSNTLEEVKERMTIEDKLNGTNTNNQELYNKYMKDANNYDKMKAEYDKQEEAYKKEHDKLSDEWHKYKYGTPEYENAYKKLTEHSNQHYNKTKDMRDKLFKQKEIKALEEQGEKVVFDSKSNLLFHPSYYDKNATRKVDFGIDVNSPTAIKDKQILDSVTGQLSDGIWENSPGQDKYWSNMNYEQHNNRITFATSERGKYDEYSRRYIANPFSSKSDQEVKDYVANKIKQIAKIEMKDDPSAGTWDRNNTAVLNYLSREDNITVADAYNLYDRLKGRTPKVQSSINDDIRRKAYQKYLKEHPNSKMTYNNFIK